MSIQNTLGQSKSVFKSKTVILAVLQALLAVVAVYSQAMPQWAGYLVLVKSAIDVLLRFVTQKPIGL